MNNNPTTKAKVYTKIGRAKFAAIKAARKGMNPATEKTATIRIERVEAQKLQ